MGSPLYRTSAEVQQLRQGLANRGLLQPLSILCREYNVALDDVLQRKRNTRIVMARDACIVRMLMVPMSSPEVGNLLGMDHTSILAARNRYMKRDRGSLLG
jgi:chromosomal replication initiation ATPase DnaA